ncbi:hypothetical protein Trydic_g12165 [Trypoxylus dichotomus]
MRMRTPSPKTVTFDPSPPTTLTRSYRKLRFRNLTEWEQYLKHIEARDDGVILLIGINTSGHIDLYLMEYGTVTDQRYLDEILRLINLLYTAIAANKHRE